MRSDLVYWLKNSTHNFKMALYIYVVLDNFEICLTLVWLVDQNFVFEFNERVATKC